MRWYYIRCDVMWWDEMTWHDIRCGEMIFVDIILDEITWHDIRSGEMTWYDMRWDDMI